MARCRTSYTPSRARRQAAAALTRGHRTRRRHADHPGEIPGQLSIEDVLTELTAEDQDHTQGEN